MTGGARPWSSSLSLADRDLKGCRLGRSNGLNAGLPRLLVDCGRGDAQEEWLDDWSRTGLGLFFAPLGRPLPLLSSPMDTDCSLLSSSESTKGASDVIDSIWGGLAYYGLRPGIGTAAKHPLNQDETLLIMVGVSFFGAGLDRLLQRQPLD